MQEIYGYTKNKGKEILMWIFYILTVGILRLFFFWFPRLMIAATHSKCSLKVAVVVVLKVNILLYDLGIILKSGYHVNHKLITFSCYTGEKQLYFTVEEMAE